MRLFALLFCLTLVANPVIADRREILRTTANGHVFEAKRFRKGDLCRFEEVAGSSPAVTLWNQQQQSAIILDPARREYMPLNASLDWIASVAVWLWQPLTPGNSGVTVHRRFQLTDLGEERVYFGHNTKHLHLTEEVVAPSGACLASSKLERDGWYLAEPLDGSWKRGFIAINSRPVCNDVVVEDGARRNPGYAVYEQMSMNGRLVQTSEVVDFSEAVLDPQLFQVPADYRKVDSMPSHPAQRWEDRWQMDWRMLCRAVQSWFD